MLTVLPGFTRTARLEALFAAKARRLGTSVAEVEAEAAVEDAQTADADAEVAEEAADVAADAEAAAEFVVDDEFLGPVAAAAGQVVERERDDDLAEQ